MNFLDRRNKISILQDRANLYNAVQDDLYDNNIPPEQQIKTIHQYLDKHTEQLQSPEPLHGLNQMTKTMPKPQVSVLTTSALISLGLDKYSTMTTQYQDINKVCDDQYQHFRELKKNGQLAELIRPIVQQKQNDKQTQAILFKADHLKEYEDQTHQGYKNQQSQYRRAHKFPDDQEHETKHNLQKNDLNEYFNAYLKHRDTLRGAPPKTQKGK